MTDAKKWQERQQMGHGQEATGNGAAKKKLC